MLTIVGAAVLLQERVRPSFAFFAVPALIGAWLLAFPRPLTTGIDQASVTLLGLGPATLWAAGAVRGRLVATKLTAVELTTLRFAFGLPAALIIVLATDSPLWVPDVSSTLPAVGIALVPGPPAIWMYFVGLMHRGVQGDAPRTCLRADRSRRRGHIYRRPPAGGAMGRCCAGGRCRHRTVAARGNGQNPVGAARPISARAPDAVDHPGDYLLALTIVPSPGGATMA